MVAQNGSNNNSLTHERTKITVIGGGAWGTALAIHAARMGHDTLLWARETEVVEGINGPDKENKLFLKGFKVPENLKATGDAAAAVEHGELLLTVIPTPFLAVTLKPLKDKFRPDQIIISCTKGIQNETLETPDQILQRVLPEALHSRLAFLSGPSFAAEVAAEQPTCVTIASTDQAVAARAQTMLSTPRFRCYRTSDVRGMGDLVLTCTGDLSRNRTVGLRIGKGEKLEDIIKSMNAVAEGVLTSKSAYNLAHKLNVDTPIVEGIYRVIHGGADPVQVVTEVMSRDLREEVDPEVMQAAASTA
jgi:glycerol-3-phosphate dehydrogenase